jgi:nitrilase
MKIALLQMVSSPSVTGNLERARVLLEDAAARGAELAALPEYFCLLGRHDCDKVEAAEEPGHGPVQDFLALQARRLGMWVVGGTLPVRAPGGAGRPGQVYNRCCVYTPTGECAAHYDKIHLFRFDNGTERYDESLSLQPGREPVVVDVASRAGQTWRLGLSICYDLRFPELYRTLVARGAELLLVPSAFTYTTGQAHWETLLRARAIENLAYVAAPAQGGHHENGRRTWGHSVAYDPWGVPLGMQAEGEGCVVVELDAARLAHCRAQLPALGHRVL